LNLDIEKIEEYLDSEEFKKYLDDYSTSLDKKVQESRDYFESDDFNTKLNALKSWMIQHNVFIVDGEDFESFSELSYFYKITSSISDSLDAFEKTDDTIPFSNTYIEYREFTVRHIHGQGSITRLELDISKLRDNNINKIIL
jgi:hypothetical protein